MTAAPNGQTRPSPLAKLSRPFQVLVASLLAAVIAPIVGAVVYSGHTIWPLFLTAYAGAALAFLTALAWDRHSRLETEARQRESEERREQDRLRQAQEHRVLEARRRFGALELELVRLKASIDRTKREQAGYKHFFPDLPTGTWQAANGPLALIVSDYELMADLSTFYGHVEELRWRLRFKADPNTDEKQLNPLIDTLVGQMAEAVDVLLEHVREQIANPRVEHVVGAPTATSGLPPRDVARRRQFTGAIRVQTPEELARAAEQALPGIEGAAPGR
ncbi:MAG: hypothetical protein ACXVRE_09015 [Gaiellaceae bacterium]